MDQDKILKIADDQINFLDRMSSQHRTRLETAINRLERRITDRLTLLDTDSGGSLIGPKTNLSQAQKIHSDLTQIFDEEYGEGIRKTVKEYSESLPYIQEQYKEMGEAAKFTGVDKDMIQTLKTRDLQEYTRFGVQAQDQIASALYDHVVAQSPFSSLRAAIAGALIGHVDARGRSMANYAKQMANDGIMNFHNAVNLKKGQDLGFTHFLYIGNIIADSRDFCVKRAGNVYTKEQIDSWTFPWKGKSGPAMTHRGGFNCRHHWQPVRKEWIPEGGIEVQSWFDRAGVMPVSKLPAAITGAPKFKAYQVWQKSILVDKKPVTAAQVAQAVGGKQSTISTWMSRWNKGFDMPKGWQSVVRDLEAEAGGFDRAVIDPSSIEKLMVPSPTAEKAAIAIKEATKDALTIAKEEIETAAEEYRKLYSKTMETDLEFIYQPDSDKLFLVMADLEAKKKGLPSGGYLKAAEREAIRAKAATAYGQLNPAFDKIRANAVSILEFEKSPAFKAITDAQEAKLFYESATAQRNAFENYFKKFGFQRSQFGDLDGRFSEASRILGPDASIAQKSTKAFYSKLVEQEVLIKRARYQWLNQADEATYLAERRKVTNSIIRLEGTSSMSKAKLADFTTKAQLRTAAGLDFVPIDLLDSMADDGYKLRISLKKARAFYRDSEKTAHIFFGTHDTSTVIAHEWAHAIDGFFQGSGNSGGSWSSKGRVEAFITKADGDTYRGWYNSRHSGTKKKFVGNGDGYYHDNNWINTYEGRIYPGQGVGHEWWAMNLQRYSSYTMKRKTDNIMEMLSKGMSEKDIEGFFDIMPAGTHSSQTADWLRAKKMYPELTEFIDKSFGQRTMFYKDVKESWFDQRVKVISSSATTAKDIKTVLDSFNWDVNLSEKANLSKLFKFYTPDRETVAPAVFLRRVREYFGTPDLMDGKLGLMRDWMDEWKS